MLFGVSQSRESHLLRLYGHSYCTCSLKQSTISILLLSPLPHHQELDSQMDQKPWKDLVMVPSEQKGKGLAKDKILHSHHLLGCGWYKMTGKWVGLGICLLALFKSILYGDLERNSSNGTSQRMPTIH